MLESGTNSNLAFYGLSMSNFVANRTGIISVGKIRLAHRAQPDFAAPFVTYRCMRQWYTHASGLGAVKGYE
jgi:hypothetical protein